jgi:hypothetical protein
MVGRGDAFGEVGDGVAVGVQADIHKIKKSRVMRREIMRRL